MPIKDSSQEVTSSKHPVPQNVMDVEFKVVGDLTVRQILYLFIGGIIIFVLYKAGLPAFWQWVFIIFVGILSLGLAFVPIQERGLDKWAVIFINSMIKPTQMLWKKMPTPPAYFLADYAQIIKNEIITLTPIKSRVKLDDYLSNLTDVATELDKVEAAKISQIAQHMTTTKSDDRIVTQLRTEVETIPQTLVVPTISNNEETEQIQTTTEVTEPKENTTEPEHQIEKNTQSTINLPTATTSKAPSQVTTDEMTSKMELLQGFAGKPPLLEKESSNTQNEKIEESGFVEKPIENQGKQQIDRPMTISNDNSVAIDTGKINLRRITKLPPIIVAEDIKDIKEQEENLEKKVSELLEVAKRARAQYQIKTGNVPIETADKEPLDPKAKERLDELKKEQTKIVGQITKSKVQVGLLDKDAKGREKLETQIKNLTEQNQLLETRLKQIQSKLTQTPSNEPESHDDIGENKTQSVASEFEINENKGQVIQTDDTVNHIRGIVKTRTGELIDGAIVLIKDNEGNVTRALKTNSLGQFSSQSSVVNGTYLIEVIKGGHKFDIMKVEAKGIVMSPLYFVEK